MMLSDRGVRTLVAVGAIVPINYVKYVWYYYASRLVFLLQKCEMFNDKLCLVVHN